MFAAQKVPQGLEVRRNYTTAGQAAFMALCVII